MHVEAVRPGDPNRLAIVSNGCCTVKFRRCEDTGLAEVTLTGTCTADPGREELDLVQVSSSATLSQSPARTPQGGVFGDTLIQFPKDHACRPALLVDQEIAKNIEPLCFSEVTQACGIEHPDGGDGGSLLGHGSTSAATPTGRSARVICPCINSTALVAVIRPRLQASTTACA